MRFRFAVNISGMTDNQLESFGFSVVASTPVWRLIEDKEGDVHMVHNARPFLMVDDPNDAASMSGGKSIYVSPDPSGDDED